MYNLSNVCVNNKVFSVYIVLSFEHRSSCERKAILLFFLKVFTCLLVPFTNLSNQTDLSRESSFGERNTGEFWGDRFASIYCVGALKWEQPTDIIVHNPLKTIKPNSQKKIVSLKIKFFYQKPVSVQIIKGFPREEVVGKKNKKSLP